MFTGKHAFPKAQPRQICQSHIYRRRTHDRNAGMRRAFQIELGVEHEILSKIRFEELVILRFENIERKRVPAFLDRVNDFLERGKHRLPEKCAAQIVDLSIDDIGAHLRIARLLEQMMRKQLFVEGRGNLRQENRVLVILKTVGIFARTRYASSDQSRAASV